MIQRYIDMLADTKRLETMQHALGTLVKPGDVVVDIGTGTGAFALFAARAGARKVYAVEYGPAAEVAESMVRANGAADVITIVRADAADWDPPEPIDVVVFEDFEDTGIGAGLARLACRWKRHLRAGGRFVPHALSVNVAAVEHEAEHTRGFPFSGERAYGLDLGPIYALAEHVRSNCHVKEEHLLTAPEVAFEYRLGEPLSDIGTQTLEAPILRAGHLHGLTMFFDAYLAPDISWSNAPSPTPTVWQSAFLHTRKAARVAPSDRLRVQLGHVPWGKDAWHWSWKVQVVGQDGAVRHEEARSTFDAEAMSVAQLRRNAVVLP